MHFINDAGIILQVRPLLRSADMAWTSLSMLLAHVWLQPWRCYLAKDTACKLPIDMLDFAYGMNNMLSC